MGDVLEGAGRDDAPLAASKNRDRADIAGDRLSHGKGGSLSGATVTINRPRQQLYDYWRDFTHLPSFMDNVVAVERLDDKRSRWTVKAPGDRSVQWTSVLTEEVPGRTLAWTSEEGADVPNSGRIDFSDSPGGRGSWVRATILYDPPAGIIGKVIAKMFQREPAIQARRDLRRFKQLMETGEVATSAHTRKQHDEETD